MTQPLPPLTKDLIEAFAASAVAWLVRLLGGVLHPNAARRKRLLSRLVNHIERYVECIIFLRAVHAFGPPPRRRRRPRSVPPGFRRTRGNVRRLWKSARIRARRGATFIGRIARLLEALAHSDVYVAHYLKRLVRGLRLGGLVACVPPAVALGPGAPRAPAFADSS